MNIEKQILEYVLKKYSEHYHKHWCNGDVVRVGTVEPNHNVFYESISNLKTYDHEYVSVTRHPTGGYRLNMWDKDHNHYFGAYVYEALADAIAAVVVTVDVLMGVPMEDLFA